MARLKELCNNPELFSSGHRACAGCGEALAVRQILLAAPQPVIGIMPTGCTEIFSSIYPHSAWQIPMIHTAFETAASTASGVETAYRFRKKMGSIKDDLKFIAFGGDGGTYDIGFQALSGAFERRHRFLYVCTDNEGYMNTGIQRSSATPYGAHTTTSPAGSVVPGKMVHRKDILEIVIAHNVAYAAQTTISVGGQAMTGWRDLVEKVQKALAAEGPSFLNVLVPCPLGWGYPGAKTVEIAQLATDTCFWPVYEYENGKYTINYEPKEKKPVEEFMKPQGRFAHLFKSDAGRAIIEENQRYIDAQWALLKKKQEAFCTP